jgi:hypothetical protein
MLRVAPLVKLAAMTSAISQNLLDIAEWRVGDRPIHQVGCDMRAWFYRSRMGVSHGSAPPHFPFGPLGSTVSGRQVYTLDEPLATSLSCMRLAD